MLFFRVSSPPKSGLCTDETYLKTDKILLPKLDSRICNGLGYCYEVLFIKFRTTHIFFMKNLRRIKIDVFHRVFSKLRYFQIFLKVDQIIVFSHSLVKHIFLNNKSVGSIPSLHKSKQLVSFLTLINKTYKNQQTNFRSAVPGDDNNWRTVHAIIR